MKTDLLNLGAALLALTIAIVGGAPQAMESAPTARVQSNALAPERQPDGTLALRDARGTRVPLRAYTRIASGSLLSDRVLLELSEPDRVVAFTRYAANTPLGYRYAGKPAIGARDDLEHVLALRPELLIVSDLVDPNYVARLRERGVQVFDLGPMRGVTTMLHGIRAIGWLLGAPERAERYALTLQERMTSLAPGAKGPRTLYLARYADKLFAAAAETSYHDVIEYAGLTDAAGGLVGWPELTAEGVLALDPDLLLTRTGMSGSLCRHPGLGLIRPCQPGGRIIELDGALLDDPSPTMLEAAEALRRAYVGAN
ncbi:MAG TPA: ABC transporter substrate-binding protein [Polyangiales bacterium]|nr:ABC transporter substrate-binding protein [Polyangiales bacterium]